MKITVNEKVQELRDLSYPWVGISTNGTVRIFTAWREGVCLRASRCGTWGPVGSVDRQVNMEYFKPFHGEVVLSNN